MLADPQTVTINSIATSLPRTTLRDNLAQYTTADNLTKLTVRKDKAKSGRSRFEFRLEQTKVAADPISAVNKSIGATVYIVVDRPDFGFSITELGYLVDALRGAFVTGTYTKVLGGEL